MKFSMWLFDCNIYFIDIDLPEFTKWRKLLTSGYYIGIIFRSRQFGSFCLWWCNITTGFSTARGSMESTSSDLVGRDIFVKDRYCACEYHLIQLLNHFSSDKVLPFASFGYLKITNLNDWKLFTSVFFALEAFIVTNSFSENFCRGLKFNLWTFSFQRRIKAYYDT